MWRRRTLFLTIAPLLILVMAKPTPKLFWIGVPFVIMGEAIRLWAAGYLHKLKEVTTAGPFALCRNPLYVGSFIGTVGYLIMCNQPVLWFVIPAFFWAFHGGAVCYEEHLLREKFGEDYEGYCRRVPERFIPRFRSLAGNGQFSVSQLVYNNEYRGLVAAIIMLGLYALFAYNPEMAPLRLMSR